MEIEVDETSATITLSISGTFGPQETRDLLFRLAQAREKISPPVPTVFDPATTPVSVPASWGYYTVTKDGYSVLCLHHPGFGWIGNRVPIVEAVKLAGALNHQAAITFGAALAKLAQASVGPDGEVPPTPATPTPTDTGGQFGGGHLH